MNLETIPRYPLAWPLGWVRTPHGSRRRSQFTQTIQSTAPDAPKRVGQVSVYTATTRLEKNLELMGADGAVLSTNVSLRLDGRPRSEMDPSDPGAAVYFRFKGRATVLACDRYIRVADNITAMAAHIDALRRIDRYGVGSLEQALAGYKALPADTAADWRSVFGFTTTETVTAETLQQRFRERAREAHPDRGGSDVGMSHLNRARDFALAELLER
jgi:hypothetical protein